MDVNLFILAEKKGDQQEYIPFYSKIIGILFWSQEVWNLVIVREISR